MKKIIVLDKPGEKEIVVRLNKKSEEEEILGLVLGKKEGDYELKTIVDHKTGNTKSRMNIRGIAKNGARVKITGLIKIEKKAKEADGFLEAKFLILDNKSSVVVEPVLEIENNDVKVGHAVTVSTIDSEQLFYLTSRGIEKKKAEALLVTGFLKEITDKI